MAVVASLLQVPAAAGLEMFKLYQARFQPARLPFGKLEREMVMGLKKLRISLPAGVTSWAYTLGERETAGGNDAGAANGFLLKAEELKAIILRVATSTPSDPF